jgi:hypothetical protein
VAPSASSVPNEATMLPVAIVNESSDARAVAFVKALQASPRLEAVLLPRDAAMDAVRQKRPGLAVVLGPGFRMPSALGQREKPAVEFVHHPLCAPGRKAWWRKRW